MVKKMDLLLVERIDEFRKTVINTEVTNSKNEGLLLEEAINEIHQVLLNIRDTKKDLYIIGNGGSAAIASHAVIDFINVGNISARTLHDSATLTCIANDYGYDNVFSKVVTCSLKPDDLLIAISSSGESNNIVNAVDAAKKNGVTVITFSGFSSNNRLRIKGDINFWNNSRDYGMVEIAHQFILHNISDRF